MGLIQRAVEAAGIATISVSLSDDVSRKVKPPRAVYNALPLGHPLGFPGETARQLQMLRCLLKHLVRIDTPGTIVTFERDENEAC